MYLEQINESLTFHLQNVAYSRFTQDADYQDIISPFTRIYLITEGCGSLIIGNNKIALEAGRLYLIPSFTSCSYHFREGLSHYYIHFRMDQPNGLSVYNLFSIANISAACDLDYKLLARMVHVNPDLQLPHHHPRIYQSKPWMNKKVEYHSAAQHLETLGILKQLFSRFLASGKNYPVANMLKYNIQAILLYIQNNLEQNITVDELACIACFSKDHFSRVFKTIIGLAPCDYIISKRIERAQFLLLTTHLSHSQIIDQTGFRSISYFSRIFKKQTSISPAQYRKKLLMNRIVF
ncbi:MAG: AraC family transcriptional regulator [Prolixibacteraceae bacterium]|jgi:AraC-like DNA-binding protein|nr:AraC family transcriptional regulator [Prolixibacteraceae bacterium]